MFIESSALTAGPRKGSSAGSLWLPLAADTVKARRTGHGTAAQSAAVADRFSCGLIQAFSLPVAAALVRDAGQEGQSGAAQVGTCAVLSSSLGWCLAVAVTSLSHCVLSDCVLMSLCRAAVCSCWLLPRDGSYLSAVTMGLLAVVLAVHATAETCTADLSAHE